MATALTSRCLWQPPYCSRSGSPSISHIGSPWNLASTSATRSSVAPCIRKGSSAARSRSLRIHAPRPKSRSRHAAVSHSELVLGIGSVVKWQCPREGTECYLAPRLLPLRHEVISVRRLLVLSALVFFLPAYAQAQDWDSDGEPDISDNCLYEGNGAVSLCTNDGVPWPCCTGNGAGPTCGQADSGGIGLASLSDGIGDACQCGDTNNNGFVTSTDFVKLTKALTQSPPFNSVGGNAACTSNGVPYACCTDSTMGSCDPGLGAPGLNKCNVGATVVPGLAGCTASDATIITRHLASLGPWIQQGCDAANP